VERIRGVAERTLQDLPELRACLLRSITVEEDPGELEPVDQRPRVELDRTPQVRLRLVPGRPIEAGGAEQAPRREAGQAAQTPHLRVPLSEHVVRSCRGRVPLQSAQRRRAHLLGETRARARSLAQRTPAEGDGEPHVAFDPAVVDPDGRAGVRLGLGVPAPLGISLRLEHAEMDGLTGRLPERFRVLGRTRQRVPIGLEGLPRSQEPVELVPAPDGAGHGGGGVGGLAREGAGQEREREAGEETETVHACGSGERASGEPELRRAPGGGQ
jgi:hypothetical protein